MTLVCLDEHRPATFLALLQVAIIVGGTLCVFAVTKHWDDLFFRAMPWPLRFVRSGGLLLLAVPPGWLISTIVRSTRSRSRVEPVLWHLVGVALFLGLVLLFSSCIFRPFMPVDGPLQTMD